VAAAEAALLELAAPITQAIAEEAVADRFISLLQAILSSGGGHVEALTGGPPQQDAPLLGWSIGADGTPRANGKKLGWVDQHYLYLLPDVAAGVVQELAGRLGQRLPPGSTTIGQRLDDAHLLCRHDTGRLTAKVPVATGRQRCWVLARSTVIDAPDRPEQADDA
jgi:hypothetical protein